MGAGCRAAARGSPLAFPDHNPFQLDVLLSIASAADIITQAGRVLAGCLGRDGVLAGRLPAAVLLVGAWQRQTCKLQSGFNPCRL